MARLYILLALILFVTASSAAPPQPQPRDLAGEECDENDDDEPPCDFLPPPFPPAPPAPPLDPFTTGIFPQVEANAPPSPSRRLLAKEDPKKHKPKKNSPPKAHSPPKSPKSNPPPY